MGGKSSKSKDKEIDPDIIKLRDKMAKIIEKDKELSKLKETLSNSINGGVTAGNIPTLQSTINDIKINITIKKNEIITLATDIDYHQLLKLIETNTSDRQYSKFLIYANNTEDDEKIWNLKNSIISLEDFGTTKDDKKRMIPIINGIDFVLLRNKIYEPDKIYDNDKLKEYMRNHKDYNYIDELNKINNKNIITRFEDEKYLLVQIKESLYEKDERYYSIKIYYLIIKIKIFILAKLERRPLRHSKILGTYEKDGEYIYTDVNREITNKYYDYLSKNSYAIDESLKDPVYIDTDLIDVIIGTDILMFNIVFDDKVVDDKGKAKIIITNFVNIYSNFFESSIDKDFEILSNEDPQKFVGNIEKIKKELEDDKAKINIIIVDIKNIKDMRLQSDTDKEALVNVSIIEYYNKLSKENKKVFEKYFRAYYQKIQATETTNQPITGGMKKTKRKNILGKERCIYKKAGDRKEYVKYKGTLITVREFKKGYKKKTKLDNILR